MHYELRPDGAERLAAYVDLIGSVLGHEKRRASFATYAVGLLGEGDRKSVEPIAARSCADPKKTDAAHQRLLHFLSVSDWSDVEVRRKAAQYALASITRDDPIAAWIIDDTGMLKQGSHSVGVQRQYTGSAGKITNCQVAVSLSLATRRDHVPIDFDLYLPRSWTSDPKRRREAQIPKSIRFRTKHEIALDLIRGAISSDFQSGPVLADCAYGDSASFRRSLRQLGLHYGVGVSTNIKIWRVDKFGFRRGSKISVKDLAVHPRTKFRKVTWREGTKVPLSARFAFRRVVPCRADGVPPDEREAVWLIIEWENGKEAPAKYHLCSLPRETTKKKLVRLIKQRWRTERTYEDLKGELGFDHFEGRRYRGWQHHVSVVLCCYAFAAAERSLAFPPRARGDSEQIGASAENRSQPVAARAPFPRFIHLGPTRDRPRLRAVAAAMPRVPPSAPTE